MSQIAGHLEPYLVLAGLLFSIGAFGFLAASIATLNVFPGLTRHAGDYSGVRK